MIDSKKKPRPDSRQPKPSIAIITPASAEANTGNWHTAARWARFLRPHYRVRVQQSWSGERDGDDKSVVPDALIALHARRSAASVAAFARACPDRPLIVVLTGTDLYRDIAGDAAAQASLERATRLVVLNELGARALPARLRGKVAVVLQSAPRLSPAAKPKRHFVVAAVGHLRDEKDPRLVMDCAQRLAHDPLVQFVHIGAALDPALGSAARACMAQSDNYRWLGGLPRALTRQRMRRAHLLLHPSRMEGGAQAIIEAITAGTPVVASRIDGNVGLLGTSYPGFFPASDTMAAARLIERAAHDPAFYRALAAHCKKRAGLFDPRREAATLLRLLSRAFRATDR
jgi:putative glycosyltransferase (TIGR04348 family)